MKFRYAGIEMGGQHGNILVRDFQNGELEIRSQDTEIPNGDGTLPGKDFFGGRTWPLDLVTNHRNLKDAFEEEARLAAAWHDRYIRMTPTLRVPLSYDLGDGKWRRVYGRPGRYAGPTGSVVAKQGAAPILADFRVMDYRYFDETENRVELKIVPASAGGLQGPLQDPLQAIGFGGEPRAGFVNNGVEGLNEPTPLKLVFHGPVTDPWVRAAAGWEVRLNATLAYDVSVTVDPLTQTVTRSDGASVAGILARRSRLSQIELPPGQSELTFGGTDITGTATVELFWRNASVSIGG